MITVTRLSAGMYQIHCSRINYVVPSDFSPIGLPLFLRSVAPYIDVPWHAPSPSTFLVVFILASSDCLQLFRHKRVLAKLPRLP